MDALRGFSDPLELPQIPEGSGVILIEDVSGHVLQVAASNNVRRRIGEMMDSQGTICAYGPKIYEAQERGRRIFVRWKLTEGYKKDKPELIKSLNPAW